MEMSFFELPNGHPVLTLDSYLCGIFVVLCVCGVTFASTYKHLNKTPAQTLRLATPNLNSKSINFTTKGIFKKMNFDMLWNIRDMFRNKARTITGIVGIATCAMLIVCAFGMLDSLNHFIKLQFEDLYNFKYKLTLKRNLSDDEIKLLTDTYGNKTSEVLLVEVKNGKKTDSNNIFISDADNFVRFVDNKDNFITLNKNDGLYVTYKLASVNNYKIGDTITWHIIGDNTYYKSKIVGFNRDPQNQNITMTRAYFESLNIKYVPSYIYTNKKINSNMTIDNVEVIQNISSIKGSMTKMLSTMKSMIVLIIFIAVILGLVIIYNMGILSFSEKQYQFATLKVLGFQDKQIKKIFIKQNIMICVVAIIIGLPSGYLLIDWLFKKAIADTYDFSAYVLPITYVYATVGTFLVTYFVSKFLARKINSIDMVSSLKGNE